MRGINLSGIEGNRFDGDKAIVGSLELDGDLRFDSSPGPEQVTNGTPSSATGWTLGADWAYGSSLFTKAVGVGTSTVSQDTCVGVVNDIVRVVHTIAAGMTGTSLTMSFGGVTGTARTAAGTYTEYITCTSTAALTFTPSADFVGSISTFSVKKVGVIAGDRVNLFVGDRLSAGVAQAGDAGLFIQSEDGTRHFIGDRIGFGTIEPALLVHLSTASDTSLLIASTAANRDCQVLFGDPDSNTAGQIVYSHNGDAMRFFTGGTERFRAVAAGLLVNAIAAYADNGQLLEVNKSADDGGIGLFCWSTTDAERALLEFHKSSSATIGTKALVADDEAAGGIIWKVADGAVNWSPIASIEAFVDAVPGAGDTGGRLVFSTTADGAAAVTVRLTIDSAGLSTFTGNVLVRELSLGQKASAYVANTDSAIYTTTGSASYPFDATGHLVIQPRTAVASDLIFALNLGSTTPAIAGVIKGITGAFLINATAAYADNGQLFEVNKSADDGGIGLFCWSTTDAERALIEFHKSSSATIGTKALIADDEAAGGIVWKVADGAVNWRNIASIEAFVDAAPAAGDTAGRIVISTTPDGSTTLVAAVTIDNAGNVGVGVAPATSLFPSGFVVIGGDTNVGYVLKPTSSTQEIGFGSNGTGCYIDVAGAATAADNILVFRTTNANSDFTMVEGLRVDSTQGVRCLAGNLKIANATDGGTGGMHIRSKRAVSAAMSSGTTANIATQIPSGALILGAQFNVDTLITGATSWAAAFNTGSTTALVTGQAVAQNTKANKLVVPELATAATDITITGSGGDFTAGVIEAIVYYCDVSSMANA